MGPDRLVNIGIGTDIDTLSAILLQYRYRRYFYTGVSGAVSAILFRLIFADIRYRYNLSEEEIKLFYLTYIKQALRSLWLPVHSSVLNFYKGPTLANKPDVGLRCKRDVTLTPDIFWAVFTSFTCNGAIMSINKTITMAASNSATSSTIDTPRIAVPAEYFFVCWGSREGRQFALPMSQMSDGYCWKKDIGARHVKAKLEETYKGLCIIHLIIITISTVIGTELLVEC